MNGVFPMLKISAQQYRMFSELTRANFVEAMRSELLGHFPERSREIGEENLAAFVERTIVSLNSLNIVRECDVERFLYVLFSIGFDIVSAPQHRQLQDILFDQELPGDRKIDLLYQRAEQILNG